MSATRTAVVRWSSSILAAVGWGGTVILGVTLREAAGVNTWWLLSLSVAISFTMTASQWWRMPSQADVAENQAVYALGFQEGLGCGACPLRPEPGARQSVQTLRAIR